MKYKYVDEVFKISGSTGCCIREYDNYMSGEVMTPNGIVTVYSQENHSRLDFCYKNKWYMRTFKTRLTKQSLTMQATKFMKDIVK